MQPAMAMPGPIPAHDDAPARFSLRLPWRVWMIASPMMLCFALPLMRIQGIVYIYDLLTILAIAYMLTLPKRGVSEGAQRLTHKINFALGTLAFGVMIAFVNGLMQSESDLWAICYAGQYMLALIYGRLLYGAISTRQIVLREFAVALTIAAITAALFVLMEAALFQLAPGAAVSLHSAYLRINGFNELTFERIANQSFTTGMFRASGGWDVATPAAGMIALGVVPLSFTQWPLTIRAMLFVILFLGTAATLSRHGVAILLIAAMFFFVRGNQGMFKRVVFSLTIYTVALLAALLVSELVRQRGTGEVMDFMSGIQSRIFERTLEQGVEDSSFEARYITGTERFFRYAANNPMVWVTGYGLGADKSTAFELRTTVARSVSPDETGYVSNCWLLIIWQLGIWGFVGLFLLHWSLLFSKRTQLVGVALVSGLIVLADNYAINSRCFFLIIGVLAMSWGVMAIQTSPAIIRRGAPQPMPMPPRPFLHAPRRTI